MRASIILDKARREIGVKESPANSNKVKYNTAYYGIEVYDGLWGTTFAWCVAFVWWLFREAGASSLFYDGKKTAYCPTVESWGKKSGLEVDKDKGKAGDIVLFDFTGKGVSTHIGIIESRNADGSYNTIEGNTGIGNETNGGAVMKRIRKQNVIRCVIRPKYEQEVAPAPPSNPKTIKDVQQYLNSKINAGLIVDGSYGPLTRKALIKYWQKVVGGLAVDGDFGPKSKASASKNNLSKGDKGELVRIMQMALICKGYGMGHYGSDASFGNYTHTMVREFQKDKLLKTDSICGSKTWAELFK